MAARLSELQRIPTSGARAVEPFTVDGLELLAIPQLAQDVAGAPAGMNAGDSDTECLVLQRVDGQFVPFQLLSSPGGEDAEFFTIDGRSFLAVASIRSGAGPYQYDVPSTVYEWTGSGFAPFQDIPTHAAKQWKHWEIGGRHFLGLAQGLDLPHIPGPNQDSRVYEWDGEVFQEFQDIPSTWAYNWHPFHVGTDFFLAHADHLQPSLLYRWDGQRLVRHQQLLARAGRSFVDFVRDGQHYLLAASLEEPPVLLRWTEGHFVPTQSLPGLGARELCVVEEGSRLLVVRVNFIHGSPADPEPSLMSQVYEWVDGELSLAAEFPTSGGTDVAVLPSAQGIDIAVSNSLSASVRFATDTVVYSLTTDPAPVLS